MAKKLTMMPHTRVPAAPLSRAAAAPPPPSDPFYQSAEWRQLRTAAMVRADGRCEWPGCRERGDRMEVDHIAEIKDGGARNSLANLQVLCPTHHRIKTAQARAARTQAVPKAKGQSRDEAPTD